MTRHLRLFQLFSVLLGLAVIGLVAPLQPAFAQEAREVPQLCTASSGG